MDELKLCYVDGCWAYFTTQRLEDQWGDDWDDAPYEHNAGAPYAYHESDKERGRAPWRIMKVAWDGPLVTPCEGVINSRFTVKGINGGDVVWLRSETWHRGDHVRIAAGTTLEWFCDLVAQGGGQVYLPKEDKR